MVLLKKDGAHATSSTLVQKRLADHFLARLVHASRAEAVERAVVGGLLTEAEPETSSGAPRKGKPAKANTSWTTIADLGMDANNDHNDGLTTTPRGPRLRPGSRLEGLAGPDLYRALKRSGITLEPADMAPEDGADSDTDAIGRRRATAETERALVTRILRAVRNRAEPPGAADVATLLLLASAFAGIGFSMKLSLALLRQRRPIVSLVCAVEGFESNLLNLMRQGLVLPGRVATSDGFELRWRNDVRFRGSEAARHEVIVFRGKRADDMDTEAVRRQVGIAAQSGYPILGIAETEDALPESLRLASSLNLRSGPLTIGIVGATMDAVLGESPVEMNLLDGGCHLLSLADLAVAIRPGASADRALQVLCNLAAARHRAQDGGRSSKDSGSGRSGGSSTSWKGSTSSRRGDDQTTGSEIVRPVTLMTSGDVDPFVPSVETLSGYGEAKDWALALKQDLDLWRAGELGWDEMSVKLLLSGPPGTGKTTFARALCNSLQVPLIATSVATWLEPGYLGDVIKRMRCGFEEAVSHAPAILFIDEIDGIARRTQTGKSHEDYWNSVVNRLLELMDGTTNSDGVIIVGAANNPDAIDPALRRSGRLEKHIVIPPPDTDALVGILRHHLRHDIEHVIATRPALESMTHSHRHGVDDEREADGDAGDERRDAVPDAIASERMTIRNRGAA